MAKPKKSQEKEVPVAQTVVTATRLEDGTILDTLEAHELHAEKAKSATTSEEVNDG